jgi:hypothetical protein
VRAVSDGSPHFQVSGPRGNESEEARLGSGHVRERSGKTAPILTAEVPLAPNTTRKGASL